MQKSDCHEGGRQLPALFYYCLALVAAGLGFAASYVTIQFFTLAIHGTEPDSTVRDLLSWVAVLFVATELAAFFIVGALPALPKLRGLRFKLIACAVCLVAFEIVAIYGTQVTLVKTADAQGTSAEGRINTLKASIARNTETIALLTARAARQNESTHAWLRAEATQMLKRATALEQTVDELSSELKTLEAAKVPTTTDVFGPQGSLVLSMSRAVLISSIGLVMLGASGALLRLARGGFTDAGAAVETETLPIAQPEVAPAVAPPEIPDATSTAEKPKRTRRAPRIEKEADSPAKKPRRRTDSEIAVLLEQVKHDLRNGTLKPTMTAVRGVMGGTPPTVKRYMQLLCDDNVLIQVGNRYRVRTPLNLVA